MKIMMVISMVGLELVFGIKKRNMLGREVMGIIYNKDLVDKKGFLGDCLGEIDENLTSISDQVTIG